VNYGQDRPVVPESFVPMSPGGWVMGRLVEVADTKLLVEERGEPMAFPLLVFPGGPGLGRTMFGD
jgi:hypothetical protein